MMNLSDTLVFGGSSHYNLAQPFFRKKRLFSVNHQAGINLI